MVEKDELRPKGTMINFSQTVIVIVLVLSLVACKKRSIENLSSNAEIAAKNVPYTVSITTIRPTKTTTEEFTFNPNPNPIALDYDQAQSQYLGFDYEMVVFLLSNWGEVAYLLPNGELHSLNERAQVEAGCYAFLIDGLSNVLLLFRPINDKSYEQLANEAVDIIDLVSSGELCTNDAAHIVSVLEQPNFDTKGKSQFAEVLQTTFNSPVEAIVGSSVASEGLNLSRFGKAAGEALGGKTPGATPRNVASSSTPKPVTDFKPAIALQVTLAVAKFKQKVKDKQLTIKLKTELDDIGNLKAEKLAGLKDEEVSFLFRKAAARNVENIDVLLNEMVKRYKLGSKGWNLERSTFEPLGVEDIVAYHRLVYPQMRDMDIRVSTLDKFDSDLDAIFSGNLDRNVGIVTLMSESGHWKSVYIDHKSKVAYFSDSRGYDAAYMAYEFPSYTKLQDKGYLVVTYINKRQTSRVGCSIFATHDLAKFSINPEITPAIRKYANDPRVAITEGGVYQLKHPPAEMMVITQSMSTLRRHSQIVADVETVLAQKKDMSVLQRERIETLVPEGEKLRAELKGMGMKEVYLFEKNEPVSIDNLDFGQMSEITTVRNYDRSQPIAFKEKIDEAKKFGQKYTQAQWDNDLMSLLVEHEDLRRMFLRTKSGKTPLEAAQEFEGGGRNLEAEQLRWRVPFYMAAKSAVVEKLRF